MNAKLVGRQPGVGCKRTSFAVERVLVISSHIRSVGFDRETLTLEVRFTNGRVYQYLDVPESVYCGLLSARSAGRYFNDRIRDVYRFIRV